VKGKKDSLISGYHWSNVCINGVVHVAIYQGSLSGSVVEVRKEWYTQTF